MTQVALSGQVGRSESWLAKIERGERTIEAIKDLLMLARVLRVKPVDLIGGIELPTNGGGPLDPPKGIIAVRRAIQGVLRVGERGAPAVEDLQRDVDRVRRLDASGFYEGLSLALPQLIIECRRAAEQEMEGAWECLAGAYQTASSLARTAGESELTWIAADRAAGAAERSGNLVMVGLSRQRLVSALLEQGWLDDAGTVCSDALDAVAPSDGSSREGWTVWGLLHLVGALTSARGGDIGAARRELRDARAAAERVGAGANDFWEAFTPESVGVMEVAVELEGGDVATALRLADRVVVDQVATPERRAHHCLTVAKAHTLRQHDGAAEAQLLEAERHAAEVLRYSVQAHEIVRLMLKRERKSQTPRLRGLAERMGIKA